MNKDKFCNIITSKSIAATFDEAKTEWVLDAVQWSDSPCNCLCDHEIHKLCWIKNKHNQQKVLVGSTCVTKFISKDLLTDRIFLGLQKICEDHRLPMSKVLQSYVVLQKYIGDWEDQFLTDTRNKKILSVKQLHKRIEINDRVLVKTGYMSAVRQKLPDTVIHKVDKPVLRK